MSKSTGQGGSTNELLDNRAKYGCFGPFPNTMDSNDIPLCGPYINFNSAQDKRRRLMRNGSDIPIDLSDSTSPHPTLDLNRLPIPTQVPLPDVEVDSPSSSSKIRNTMVVGNILGFEVEDDNSILKEVLGEDGENQIIQ
ncbi:unnamed protein product [Lactuca virosa]|uniref:Uncharacterized protein n=1 Tax=Lactuca virosa TaxID=75947 RepID=A0AAU9NQ60_9ASTR|nr:unnamed protein product [Lactuca virosa]